MIPATWDSVIPMRKTPPSQVGTGVYQLYLTLISDALRKVPSSLTG